MKVSESRSTLLLAAVLDGTDQGDGVRMPEKRCPRCGHYMVRFQASPGLQQKVGIAPETETCVTTEGGFLGGPCIGALKAKPLLDALKRGSRR